MSWAPADLLTDQDLVAYEGTILTRFGVQDWQERRARVLEDWIWPQLRIAGFPPERFRTRYTPEIVYGLTSGTYTNKTTDAIDAGTDDLALATILAASSDALVVGSRQQFRGCSVRMHEGVSAVAATLTVELWQDTWKAVPHYDGTQLTGGVPFSKGGAITWTVPSEWAIRTLSTGTTPYYFARLRISAAPTSATAGQVSVIRRSVLCAPLAFKVLASIFREAPMNQDGPWADRATYYEEAAALAFQRALALVGGEFDADSPPDDLLDDDDQAQTREDAGSPMRWERS